MDERGITLEPGKRYILSYVNGNFHIRPVSNNEPQESGSLLVHGNWNVTTPYISTPVHTASIPFTGLPRPRTNTTIKLEFKNSGV